MFAALFLLVKLVHQTINNKWPQQSRKQLNIPAKIIKQYISKIINHKQDNNNEQFSIFSQGLFSFSSSFCFFFIFGIFVPYFDFFIYLFLFSIIRLVALFTLNLYVLNRFEFVDRHVEQAVAGVAICIC